MTEIFGSRASYEVIHLLEEAGYEAVFVGGAVRDYSLGKQAHDIDIATSAEPYEVKEVFSNTIDIGIAHGTVLVIVDGEPIEVTTYRTESTYSDHRRPDEVQFVKSLREDLLRRDFTMNALAMTKDGQLIDLFGGKEDMDNKLVRAVGVPAHRFREDALRMLRAVRFSSVLDFEIEDNTLQAIHENAEQIRYVSIERIKIEMDKLFVGSNPVKAFNYLSTSRLAETLPLYPASISGLERTVPFESSLEGWAFLTVTGNAPSSQMANAYKLSNDERKFITSVQRLYTSRITKLFTIDDYYSYDLNVLNTVEKFFQAIHTDLPTITTVEITKNKKELPIQSIKDLAADGTDLIKWAERKGGQWTGQWIKKIEKFVLHGHIKNDPNTIRDWFINDFKREK